MTAGNYSYRARTAWGDGYLLIGDAFGFIDPVFSSGVMLAMTSVKWAPTPLIIGWMIRRRGVGSRSTVSGGYAGPWIAFPG